MTMQSFTSLDSGSPLVKISEQKSSRDKSKSTLRRISNSIYLNETKFKFGNDYYKKINEKYQTLSKQNFKKALEVQQANHLQYRYKPNKVQVGKTEEQHYRDKADRTLEKSPNAMKQKLKILGSQLTSRLQEPRISYERMTNAQSKNYGEKTLVTSPSKRRVLVQLQLQAANAR